jgi:hypothetical protein
VEERRQANQLGAMDSQGPQETLMGRKGTIQDDKRSAGIASSVDRGQNV